jgi:hypothetical protein
MYHPTAWSVDRFLKMIKNYGGGKGGGFIIVDNLKI